jgi:hypothetical protein
VRGTVGPDRLQSGDQEIDLNLTVEFLKPEIEAMEKLRNPGRALYDLYITRSVYFGEHPPEADWDGAFTFVTK